MKRSVQKWMAVILSCCICLSIWSAAALAAGTGEFDPVGNLLPNPGMEEGGQNQNEWTYDKKYVSTQPHDGRRRLCTAFRRQLYGVPSV